MAVGEALEGCAGDLGDMRRSRERENRGLGGWPHRPSTAGFLPPKFCCSGKKILSGGERLIAFGDPP